MTACCCLYDMTPCCCAWAMMARCLMLLSNPSSSVTCCCACAKVQACCCYCANIVPLMLACCCCVCLLLLLLLLSSYCIIQGCRYSCCCYLLAAMRSVVMLLYVCPSLCLTVRPSQQCSFGCCWCTSWWWHCGFSCWSHCIATLCCNLQTLLRWVCVGHISIYEHIWLALLNMPTWNFETLLSMHASSTIWYFYKAMYICLLYML